MPKGGQRPQKLAAKAAKRKAIVAQKERLDQLSNSLDSRIAVAADCPIELCLRSDDLFEVGIGYVMLARHLPSHLLSCAFFLVDVYCLGVKDAFHRELSPMNLQEWMDEVRTERNLVPIEPGCARKLLRDAVAYAGRAKLPPAKDYRVVEKLFGAADAQGCGESFVFGKDGKPFFIPGPNDGPRRMDEVVQALNTAYGRGNWTYMVDLANLPLLDDDIGDGDDDGGPLIEHDDDEFLADKDHETR